MSAIISTEQVFFLGSGKPVPKSVVLQVAMCDLVGAEPVFVRSKGMKLAADSCASHLTLTMSNTALPLSCLL